MRSVHRFISLAVIASLSCQGLAPVAVAQGLSRADYEACQARDSEAFRGAIEGITIAAMNKALAGVDYKGAVGEEWRKGGLDELIDKRVEIAIAEVKDETTTTDRLRSIVDAQTGKRLAEKVAERVYRSEAMKAAIETMIVGVARSVGTQIELASIDASGPSLACLRAFLGPRYGETVARSVSDEAAKEFGIDPSKGSAGIDSNAVLKQHAGGLAGAAILLVRRQLANMATRVGQRVVGSVLSRIVSVAAGGVGIVLIAKDIWELTGGVFPIIASEMRSRETKEKVQEELAKSVGEQIGEHVKEIGARAAGRVIEIWQDYRRAHIKVLEVAEKDDRFRAFLDAVPVDLLGRLDDVAALIVSSEGEAGLLKRLQDGTLEEAVHRLPQLGLDIARNGRSLDRGLKWTALAGANLGRVVELDIARQAAPEEFSAGSLQRLLGLDDRLAVTRIASLPREAREILLDARNVDLKTLARSLTEGELATLASYLTGLQKEPRERVLRVVAATPGRMAVLGSGRVRDAVLASRDQAAAVDVVLRSDSGFNAAVVAADFQAAWDGRISPMLVYEKHPATLAGLGIGALALLLMMRRVVGSRRRTGAGQGGAAA